MTGRRVSLFSSCASLVMLVGCGPRRAIAPSPKPPTSSPHSPAPADPWVITTSSPDGSYHPTYLGNGYLGQVMDIDGFGMISSNPAHPGEPAALATVPHIAGGPRPASLAGLYNAGRLVTLSPLFPLRLEMKGQPFGAEKAPLADYRQTLDLRHGLLTTHATWNGQPVEITAFICRDDPALAVCHVLASAGVSAREEEPTPAPTINGRPAVLRVSFRSARTPARAASAGPTDTTLVTALTEWRNGAAAREALRQAMARADGTGGVFPPLLQRHTAAWQKLWASDIEIEGSPADQQLVHALMYQLLASAREGVRPAPGFPPMGLSNPAAFDGHVFWDADTWIYPALLPLHPELARTILDYRFRTLPGARANAAAEGKRGASYAWESADTGREVATLDTRHGRHVTADVARAFWQYYLATGDRTWLRQRAWPVLSATADYWVSRATAMPSAHSTRRAGGALLSSPSPRIGGGGQGVGAWEIRRVSTPDENAGLVDNSAWTNFSARENLRVAARVARLLGLPPDPRWTQVADGLLIPRDASGVILEYSGYQGRAAKQADTLLLLFPGDMPLPRVEQERMFRYYVDRTIRNGPAMTESVHAVIAARLGQPEEAYRRFRQSVDPFVRPPFLSFSEKRTRDNLQFLTGAAGSLQAVLYGFAGLRLEDSPTPVFHPQLPAVWSALTLRSFSWRGKRYDVMIRRGQPARLTPR